MAVIRANTSGGGGSGTITSIPKMTGESAPSGKATASAYNTNYYPYKAFSTDSIGWYVTGASFRNTWIKYEFDTAFTAKMFMGMAINNGTLTLTISGSNDDTNYTSVASGIEITTSSYYNPVDLSNNTAYKYYKFTITACTVSTQCNGLKLQLIGS